MLSLDVPASSQGIEGIVNTVMPATVLKLSLLSVSWHSIYIVSLFALQYWITSKDFPVEKKHFMS